MSETPRIPSLVTTGTLVGTLVLTLLATCAFTLRVLANRHTSLEVKRLPDFWLVFGALVFVWADFIELACAAGIGGLNYSKLSPAASTVLFIKIEWANVFLFAPANTLAKLSILVLYKRIFVKHVFCIACNVMMALIILWGVSFIIGQFLSYKPVLGAWQGGQLRFDYFTFNTAIAASGPALDFLTLCLPIPIILRLQTSTSQKLKIMSIFWLGIFVVICATLRCYYAYESVQVSTKGSNIDQYNLELYADLFGRLEAAAAIITACLPTFGPLFSNGRSLASLVRSVRSLTSLRSRSSDDSKGATSARTNANGTVLPPSGDVELEDARRDWKTSSTHKSEATRSGSSRDARDDGLGSRSDSDIRVTTTFGIAGEEG